MFRLMPLSMLCRKMPPLPMNFMQLFARCLWARLLGKNYLSLVRKTFVWEVVVKVCREQWLILTKATPGAEAIWPDEWCVGFVTPLWRRMHNKKDKNTWHGVALLSVQPAPCSQKSEKDGQDPDSLIISFLCLFLCWSFCFRVSSSGFVLSLLHFLSAQGPPAHCISIPGQAPLLILALGDSPWVWGSICSLLFFLPCAFLFWVNERDPPPTPLLLLARSSRRPW